MGAATAKAFSACRRVCPTHSGRFNCPMAAHTWLECVRCLPLALSHCRCLNSSSIAVSRCCSRPPAISRSRHSLKTENQSQGHPVAIPKHTSSLYTSALHPPLVGQLSLRQTASLSPMLIVLVSELVDHNSCWCSVISRCY